MTYAEAKEKATNLVKQMTADEKVSQLLYTSPAIKRLGINSHNWWNEALHGVARAGTATVFPQAIGMAASFNPALIGEVADVISVEARAKYNESVKYDDRDIYKGLTFWSPNINIFRDPRWGRGHETYGEDPYLTATIGCHFVEGLQGDGEFLKSAACAKHYAVHSGPEKLRHEFDARVSEQDLWETYLPAFECLVKDAKVAGVMGAYNSFNGEPCCANEHLLQDILLKQWEFEGYFVSDCGAIADFHQKHNFTETAVDSAAIALKCGCNLNCGNVFGYLLSALAQGKITEADLDNSAIRLYTIRFLLGEFEEVRPYSDVPFDKLDCEEHKALNLEIARESLVLLKNEDNFLPLDPKKIKTMGVVGPNALSRLALEGNYIGLASEYITVADGIRKVFDTTKIRFSDGSKLWQEEQNSWSGNFYLISGGLAAANNSEVTVLCVGLDSTLEGEEGYVGIDYCDGGDKRSLFLPETQRKLMESICDSVENVVVVLMSGSAIDLGSKVNKHAKAIIQAWYPGAVGGLAVAQLLAGKYSPSGRLPLTFYHGDRPLPDFEDYSMEGRTYRFLKEKPLFPFGYGLSYTNFDYKAATVVGEDDDTLTVSVTVKNVGGFDGREVVQVYSQMTDSSLRTPNFQLCGVASIYLAKGEETTAKIVIQKFWLKAVNGEGKRVNPNGVITLHVGGHQPDERSEELCQNSCMKVVLY